MSSPTAAKKKKKTFFRWPWRKETFVRRHRRHACCIVANLHLSGREVDLEGVVLELSAGGALFREAATHILDRAGEEVVVRFEGFTSRGIIMNTSTAGYGIKLANEIDDATLDRLVELHGLTAKAA